MLVRKRLSIVDDINHRVTLAIALLALVLVGLSYAVTLSHARAQVDERADEVLAAIVEAFRLPFWDHNLSNAMEIATAFSANDWVAYVRVHDAKGQPVAGVGARADAAVFREADIKYGAQKVGRVEIGLTLLPLDKQNQYAIRSSLVMLLIVVAALFLCNGLLLRRGLRRPMALLLERIRSIADGNHDLPMRDIRHHEIRTLVEQFDAMAHKVEERERSYIEANQQLQAAQAELMRHGERLEQTVAERTRELSGGVEGRPHTEVELVQAKQAADAANRAKSDFVAHMSHELRTPLNGILGSAQILRNDPALSPSQKEALDTVRQCGEHLLGLINEILDIAKIEAGRMDVERHDFSLRRLLQGLQRIFRGRADDKGLGFRLDADPSLPEAVCGDERKLRQVLMNLLGNAVKFTPSGRVTLRAARVAGTTERVRFEVEDTGPGIPPDRVGGLFVPFTQFHDQSSRHQGTGLGLAISQRLTQLMGGVLQVRNDYGHGCTFGVELELPTVEALPSTTGGSEDRVITGYQGPRRRVLIVDDNAVDRKVVAGLLAPLGFECSEAADGQECLLQVASTRPDIVLMDVTMPRLDGLATTRRLRAQPASANLPVIVVSTSVRDADRDECLAAGCTAFVPKPLQQGALLDAIASSLDLEWTWREPEPAPIARAGAPAGSVRLPMAQALLVRDAARKGHVKGIVSQLEALESAGGPVAALAQQMRELARQYRFDEIVALAER
jgi:signal transduction histidine kinase/ActR/RegA family two-component response regulator